MSTLESYLKGFQRLSEEIVQSFSQSDIQELWEQLSNTNPPALISSLLSDLERINRYLLATPSKRSRDADLRSAEVLLRYKAYLGLQLANTVLERTDTIRFQVDRSHRGIAVSVLEVVADLLHLYFVQLWPFEWYRETPFPYWKQFP